MNYEQMVADTDQVIRDAIRRSDIMEAALMIITVTVSVLMVILMVEEIRTKRAVRKSNEHMMKLTKAWGEPMFERDDEDRYWFKMGPSIKVEENDDIRH